MNTRASDRFGHFVFRTLAHRLLTACPVSACSLFRIQVRFCRVRIQHFRVPSFAISVFRFQISVTFTLWIVGSDSTCEISDNPSTCGSNEL